LLRRAECNQIEDKLDDSLSDYKKLNELEPKYEYRQKCFVSTFRNLILIPECKLHKINLGTRRAY